MKEQHEESNEQKIWRVICDIPPGCVCNYGKVAELAGLGRSARMVAPAMRKAPRDVKLPWHRVINAQGRISFPEGSVQYKRQKDMLEQEGVVFINGRVNLDRYGWQQHLDEMIWGPPE